MTTATGDESYVDIPYPSVPIRYTHPEILAVIGALHGLAPAPVDSCRVLEIGSGDGGNLIPMACSIPGGRFVGIEPSGPAVDRARALADAVGAGNVRFVHAGVEDAADDLGPFDYIVAHGVFSWVDAAVQERLFERSRRLLAPDGLAYVSYNTYPGWHARGMIREMMLYRIRHETRPRARVSLAREFLDQLSATVDATDKVGLSATDMAAFGSLLRHERMFLSEYPDAYFYHEHLERVNLPLYFHEFVARAARHGLQYVSEALYSSGVSFAYPSAVAKAVQDCSEDPLEQQQMLDFLTNRTFRESILCAADRPLVRTPDAEALKRFHVSSPLKSTQLVGDSETFTVPWGWTATTGDPSLRDALRAIGASWPLPLAVDRIFEFTPIPRIGLLNWYSRGMLELQAGPPSFRTSIDPRPRAPALARYQTRSGPVVTNLRHEQVTLDDLSRAWLPLLDGTRDVPALVEYLSGMAAQGKMAVSTPEGRPVTDPAERTQLLTTTVGQFLRAIANSALLSA